MSIKCKEQLTALLECPVCSDPLSLESSQLLYCGHSCCITCLDKILPRCDPGTIGRPVCRHISYPIHKSSQLPKNHLLGLLVEAFRSIDKDMIHANKACVSKLQREILCCLTQVHHQIMKMLEGMKALIYEHQQNMDPYIREEIEVSNGYLLSCVEDAQTATTVQFEAARSDIIDHLYLKPENLDAALSPPTMLESTSMYRPMLSFL